jgi:hypothetical protein
MTARATLVGRAGGGLRTVAAAFVCCAVAAAGGAAAHGSSTAVSGGRDGVGEPAARTQQPQQVGLFELFELRVATTLPFAHEPRNPFNLSECRVEAAFRLPPVLEEEGAAETVPRVQRVDGFYMQEFRRSFVNASIRYAQHELLEPTRPGGWYVRWSPQRAGRHSYTVSATCAGQAPPGPPALLRSGAFDAVETAASRAHGGFVQPSPNRRHFRLSHRSNASFVPIGQDIAWPTTFNGSFDTDRWISHLASNGGNFARVWLCASLVYGRYTQEIARNDNNKTRPDPKAMVALEQSAYFYDQRAAWRFDQTLRTARRWGPFCCVCVILVLWPFRLCPPRAFFPLCAVSSGGSLAFGVWLLVGWLWLWWGGGVGGARGTNMRRDR